MSIKLQALSYFWPRLSIFPYAGWQVELHLSTLRNMSYNNDCLWRPFRVIESSDWDNRLLNFIAGLGWQVTAFISSNLEETEIKTQLYLINRQASTDCKSVPSAHPSHRNNLTTNYCYRTLVFLRWSEGFQEKGRWSRYVLPHWKWEVRKEQVTGRRALPIETPAAAFSSCS